MENISSIKPFVRFVRNLTINEGDYSDFLVPYDSRLFYCLDDNGKLTFENGEFQTRPGRIFLWKSGVKYMLSSKPQHPARFIAINFDFSDEFSHHSTPIPPDYAHNFKPHHLLKTRDYGDVVIHPIVLDDLFFLQKNMESMLNEYEGQRQHSQLMLSGMMQQMLAHIFRFALGDINHSRIDSILSFINDNCHSPLSNSQLAYKFGFHPNSLNRLIILNTGMSLHQYLISCRINKALNLLESSDMTIGEIASATGFEDASYFSRIFKNKMGRSPKEYKMM